MFGYFVTPSDPDHAWVCFPDGDRGRQDKDPWDQMIGHLHAVAEQYMDDEEFNIEIDRRKVELCDCEICDEEDCKVRLCAMVV